MPTIYTPLNCIFPGDLVDLQLNGDHQWVLPFTPALEAQVYEDRYGFPYTLVGRLHRSFGD